MARYTPEFLARLRAQYEDGDLPVDEVAAEFHIGTRTLGRLALRENWDRRSTRVRDVPRAMQLLEEAEALAAASPPTEAPPTPDPPSLRFGGRVSESAIASATADDPSPPLPRVKPGVAEGGEQTPTAIDRLERLVLNEIENEEARRARRRERSPAATERGARTLAILTQTLQNLQRLRAGDATPANPPDRDANNDDDMPTDIDEFRRDLARRIAAFMESRPDDGDADESGDAARLDEVR